LSSADPDVLFRAHLVRYAPQAVARSLEAASQVATSRREFLEFAAWRFRDLIDRFSQSFDDCARNIGEPFRQAASAAMRKDPGGSKPYEGA
jgi:hypothetical protein